MENPLRRPFAPPPSPRFFLSGFAALVYQVVWQRLLVAFSGADVYSSTLIVAAFMAGLGVGHLAGGHVADRVSRRNALILFAVAELSIAAFSLASRALYYDFLYQRLGTHAFGMPAPDADPVYESAVADVLHGRLPAPAGSSGDLQARSCGGQRSERSTPCNTLGAAVGSVPDDLVDSARDGTRPAAFASALC